MTSETPHSHTIFIVALTKAVCAVAMAAAPLMFIAILYQGGFGPVPVHNRGGQVLFHINNVVVAVVFCWFWFSISAVIFVASSKVLTKMRNDRDAA